MTTYQRLTAKGRGAIAVIAIAGEGATHIIDTCFTPVGTQGFKQKRQPLTYGHWNSTGEDLLVVITENQKLEIQCHGSEAAVAAIIADLTANGATEFSPTTFPPLSADRFQSDIEHLLNSAITHRTAERLLQQLTIAPAAFADMVMRRDLAAIKTAISHRHFGLRFHRHQSIVLCGRPNAGKSSLTNAILGFERSIVTPIAGTTRDVLTHHAVIDGWPVIISDTAGLRQGGGDIEQIGIAKAKQQIENADLIIAVIDATAPHFPDESISPNLIVINKIDLNDDADLKHRIGGISDRDRTDDRLNFDSAESQGTNFSRYGVPAVRVSATDGTGIAELLEAISSALFPRIPSADQPIPLTQPQATDLIAAAQKLENEA